VLQGSLDLDFTLGFAKTSINQDNEMEPSISIFRLVDVVLNLLREHLESGMAMQIAKNEGDICQVVTNDSCTSKIIHTGLKATEAAYLDTFTPFQEPNLADHAVWFIPSLLPAPYAH